MSHRLGRVGEVLPPVAAVLFPVLFIPTLTDTYVLPRASLAVADGCLLAGWGLAASGPGLSGLDRAAFAVAAPAILAAGKTRSSGIGDLAYRLRGDRPSDVRLGMAAADRSHTLGAQTSISDPRP